MELMCVKYTASMWFFAFFCNLTTSIRLVSADRQTDDRTTTRDRDIRNAATLYTFKKKLKTFMFYKHLLEIRIGI